MENLRMHRTESTWLPNALAAFLSTSFYIFAFVLTDRSPYAILALPLGVIAGYVMAYIRSRLPTRYTFAAVPDSRRKHVCLYVSTIFVMLSLWHISTRNWMGLWAAVSMGGAVLLIMAAEFAKQSPKSYEVR